MVGYNYNSNLAIVNITAVDSNGTNITSKCVKSGSATVTGSSCTWVSFGVKIYNLYHMT